MRIAEYKQIDTIHEERVVTHPAEYDDYGNIISEEYSETVVVDTPVMGMVYRDMTPEEEAEARATADIPIVKTDAERIAELEDALEALLRGDTDA